jgi:hypothetical protein
MSARAGSFRQVWLWPMAVALLSLIGLITALIGDGAWDVASWMVLSPPLVISGMAWMRSRRRRHDA